MDLRGKNSLQPQLRDQDTTGASEDELRNLRAQIDNLQRRLERQDETLQRLTAQVVSQHGSIRQLTGELFEMRRSRTWQALTKAGGYLLEARRVVSKVSSRARGIVFHCDSPKPGKVNARPGILPVSGWAVTPAGIRAIEVGLDGGPFSTAQTGVNRDDVAERFPNVPNAALSGFRGIADLSLADNGPARLIIRITENNGNTHQQEIDVWIDNVEDRPPSPEEARRITAELDVLPLFSVVVPVYNVPEKWLRRCLDSVKNQHYPKWECCLANDAATDPHVRPLLDEYAIADPRFKVIHRSERGHIAKASNSALELATGDYIALLDCDDEITTNALLEMAVAVNASPEADMLYSDEDKIDEHNLRFDPFYKPDWSPEYFHTCMYTCHLGVYRTSIVREIGGFRSEVTGAQDYDLALRIVSRTRSIVHVPRVLYHWRTLPTSTASGAQAKDYAYVAARTALQHYLELNRIEGEILPGPTVGSHRVRFRICGDPTVSLVIPSAGRTVRYDGREINLLRMCITSIRAKSTWPRLEVIVVDNGDLSADLISFLDQHGVVRVTYNAPRFNLAQKMNFGAEHACGEHLVFLNDDTEVKSPEWIENMLEYSQQPGIGAVGARLLFPNEHIQHAGVVLMKGAPSHPYHNHPSDDRGYYLSTQVTRNYLAVTGACLMTNASLFREVNGFDHTFDLNYNDVDYCLRLHERGYRIVYTPYAELYHYESVSREGPGTVKPEELRLFYSRWKQKYPLDPYYNPNLPEDHLYYRS